MIKNSGSSQVFMIEVWLSFMASLFLEWYCVLSCVCFYFSRFPFRSSRFNGCLFFMLLPPPRKLFHCYTISTFTEIPSLGNKIALLLYLWISNQIYQISDTKLLAHWRAIAQRLPHECWNLVLVVAKTSTTEKLHISQSAASASYLPPHFSSCHRDHPSYLSPNKWFSWAIPSSALPSWGTSQNDLSSLSPTSEVETISIESSSECGQVWLSYIHG